MVVALNIVTAHPGSMDALGVFFSWQLAVSPGILEVSQPGQCGTAGGVLDERGAVPLGEGLSMLGDVWFSGHFQCGSMDPSMTGSEVQIFDTETVNNLGRPRLVDNPNMGQGQQSSKFGAAALETTTALSVFKPRVAWVSFISHDSE